MREPAGSNFHIIMSRHHGSKNKAHTTPRNTWGAATSAAHVNGRHGVKDFASLVYVTGEGWVSWREIERQVDAAHRIWRQKMALMGRYIFDGAERQQSQISGSIATRGTHTF